MTTISSSARQSIVIDEILPHAPSLIWKALTNGELTSRWLMEPKGFRAEVGCCFTFQTTPAGPWDGTIQCEVLEIIPYQRLSYSWRSGSEDNDGYGSKLDTIVTFSLFAAEAGTRLRLVHSGFEMPKNDTGYRNMGEGWKKVVKRLDMVAAEDGSSQPKD
jgi:uncharacterized protein YndB with AHSA1/START domain